jgi:glutathione S-transferase
MRDLTLVSHYLCPYVQRAIIVASEKGIALDRMTIDLAAKPDWFLALSPTGKVPLLKVRNEGAEHVLFESAAICEYFDETGPGAALLPEDPIARAKDRGWVEFASGTLADIAGLYSAPDRAAFEAKTDVLRRRFAQLEQAVALTWFAGKRFGFVDAAFGPVFRYLDAFERLVELRLASDLESVAGWRRNLADRPSVRSAIGPDYMHHLEAFLRARQSHLGHLLC